MKTSIHLSLLFIVFFCYPAHVNAQSFYLSQDSANVAVLIVDYDNPQFEGGSLIHYAPCPLCSDTSLPFEVLFDPPGDFGGITFTLGAGGDTVFDATIIWMGTGTIQYPGTFYNGYPFTYDTFPVLMPELEYYSLYGSATNDSAFIALANQAWDLVDSLEITQMFANLNYKAGIYLYPPWVGMFDPTVAKWIVFLYAEEIITDLPELNNQNLKLYPNPVAEDLHLYFEDELSEESNFHIYNQLGEQMTVSYHIMENSVDFDVSSLPAGIYYLRMVSGKQIKSGAFVKKD